MAIFYKLGFSLISVGNLFETLIYPGLFFVIWWFMKRFFGERLGFFAVLIGLSVYSLYLSTINFLPASLAMILGLLAFIALGYRKIIAASICLGLCFYTHPGT